MYEIEKEKLHVSLKTAYAVNNSESQHMPF